MRLTKIIKDQIFNDIVISNKKLNKITAELQLKENQIFTEIFNDLFTSREHELIAQMPDEWLTNVSKIRINSTKAEKAGAKPDSCYNVRFNLRHTVSKSVPRGVYLLETNREDNKVVQFLIYRDKIRKEIESVHNNIKIVIDSATTMKKLKEIWPEMETLFNKYQVTENAALVNIKLIQIINKQLGI